jgi:hypothetical protein
MDGGEERGLQTVNWMGFGVGLGVGLGIAIAQQQQLSQQRSRSKVLQQHESSDEQSTTQHSMKK